MDAQQCVKLTSTNRSIGLISHIACSDKHHLNDARIFIRAETSGTIAQANKAGTHLAASFTRAKLGIKHTRYRSSIRSDEGPSIMQSQNFFFDDLVVIARGNTPDPIPNSAVKTLSADGTPS